MKTKLLSLIFLILSIPAFAGIIIVNKIEDGYIVKYLAFYADGSTKVVQYRNGEDFSKLLPMLSKDNSGLPKDADVSIIILNPDGTLNKIGYQINPKNKDEAPQVATKGDQDATQVAEFKAQLDAAPVKAETESPIVDP